MTVTLSVTMCLAYPPVGEESKLDGRIILIVSLFARLVVVTGIKLFDVVNATIVNLAGINQERRY